MKTTRINGWLFDIDEFGSQIILWVFDSQGKLQRYTHEFSPPIFICGERTNLKLVSNELIRKGLVTGSRWVVKRDFWSGDEIEVMQLNISDSAHFPKIREIAGSYDQQVSFHNIDIPSAQYYLYLTELFPLCHLEGVIGETGNILEISPCNSAYELDHDLPPFKTMRMYGQKMRPISTKSRIVLECNNQQIELNPNNGINTINAFNDFINRHNPDLILSERGDTILLPTLLNIAKQTRSTLYLDRDVVKTSRRIETEGRTYMSYGQIIYKGPSYPLIGRWHVDNRNSFATSETGLEGLFELARLGQMPVQRCARRSPGTAMTSIQISLAVREGILIPWRKTEPERFKTALQLLTIDKGGLTFMPQPGVYENVAEIDYASMYPSLMVTHNISPETVLCACCDNQVVPEANYNICTKRRGLIPLTLEPLVERRRILKVMMQNTDDPYLHKIYHARRSAIKWMLVSCFGYMGYKNAKFGRIEAHESVTAFGRETLLTAKDIVEGGGWKMLHALTDSLWISKPDSTQQEINELCESINKKINIEMTIEGRYKWIIFLSSKIKAGRPVATRYFGVFENGKIKARGLAYRRRDTPLFIKQVQQEMLSILSSAQNIEELIEKRVEALCLLDERIAQLKRGEIDITQLIIEQTLTRNPEDYTVATRTSLAAQKLREAGIPVHPGEQVGYVISNAKAQQKLERVSIGGEGEAINYDVEEYVKRLRDAGAEICGTDF